MTLALGTSGSKALWYLTRGTGVVTLLLLTTAVVLGIVTSVRWSSPRWPRFVLEWLHRNISLVVLVFLAVHVATAVLDAFAPLRWLDAVVPFSSGYRPLWVGFGAVAFDLLVAVAVTSLLRVRIGYQTWRAVHWASYACWPLAVLHGSGTGSDTTQRWMLVIDAVAVALVAAAVFWRASVGWPSHAGARLTAFASAIVVPIALAAWLVVGPLHPGWARTAGTPAQLLGSQGARP
ncbi:MAG TPA: ferric reductase-like transmembrane domain-containing protein [Acidimicrobiales bacterium]|nr:ferric reductase-like transmembrane domain-containing protein [Acidimicrobiales bacterium]